MTEPEIDVRRYWRAVAARWWLPVIGLVAGAALAYALSFGGSDVWRGQALVYLGQPVTPSGAQVQSLSTNPATAGEIVGSAATQRRVERAAGLERGALNGKVSVAAVRGNVSRLGQNPLVRVRVEGDNRRVAVAATCSRGRSSGASPGTRTTRSGSSARASSRSSRISPRRRVAARAARCCSGAPS